MKYKVGDKVKIRKDLVVDETYGEDSFSYDMKSFLGKWVTITKELPNDKKYCIKEDGEKWYWTDEMFEDTETQSMSNLCTPMTVADLLNKTDVEIGGLIISIYYSNAYFEATIGHNKINRHSELYKRFIKAYGDMIVDEVGFDIRNENMIVMQIKVDYAD